MWKVVSLRMFRDFSGCSDTGQLKKCSTFPTLAWKSFGSVLLAATCRFWSVALCSVTHVEFLSAVTGDRNYKQGLQQSEDSTVTTAAAICIPDSSASMKRFSRLLTASVA